MRGAIRLLRKENTGPKGRMRGFNPPMRNVFIQLSEKLPLLRRGISEYTVTGRDRIVNQIHAMVR